MDELVKINDLDLKEKGPKENKLEHGWGTDDIIDGWSYNYRPPDYHTQEELEVFWPQRK